MTRSPLSLAILAELRARYPHPAPDTSGCFVLADLLPDGMATIREPEPVTVRDTQDTEIPPTMRTPRTPIEAAYRALTYFPETERKARPA